MHGLQDAEKRQKDFYVDLDTRLRHFESAEEAAKEAPLPPQRLPPRRLFRPILPTRFPRIAHMKLHMACIKSGNNANAVKAFQDFITKYPRFGACSQCELLAGQCPTCDEGLQERAGYLSEHFLKDFPESSKSCRSDVWHCALPAGSETSHMRHAKHSNNSLPNIPPAKPPPKPRSSSLPSSPYVAR